jgi:spermidine/putrescine transport system permease protein
MRNRNLLPVTLTAAALLFLYFPILILVLNSFNASKFGSSWEGWTWHWYQLLFSGRSRDIWDAVERSLIVAAGASLVSMALGTFAAWALHRYRSRLQQAHFGLVYLPIVAPDVLMGISLGILFISVGVERNLMAITVAHITFCISFVALAVLARLQDFDNSIVDAARDLGATWTRPSGASSCHCCCRASSPAACSPSPCRSTTSSSPSSWPAPGSTTLPIRIYSMIKHGSPPGDQCAYRLSSRALTFRARSG